MSRVDCRRSTAEVMISVTKTVSRGSDRLLRDASLSCADAQWNMVELQRYLKIHRAFLLNRLWGTLHSPSHKRYIAAVQLLWCTCHVWWYPCCVHLYGAGTATLASEYPMISFTHDWRQKHRALSSPESHATASGVLNNDIDRFKCPAQHLSSALIKSKARVITPQLAQPRQFTPKKITRKKILISPLHDTVEIREISNTDVLQSR